MHEILITLVIIIIVAFQFMVGYSAWQKIDLYKQIIPEAKNFETVKVYIPESQVKDINVDHILINLNYFQFPQDDEELFPDNAITEDIEIMDEVQLEMHVPEPNPDTLIWVTKGNEEKKIEYKFLQGHQEEGWSQI